MSIQLNKKLKEASSQEDPFNFFMQIEGEVSRSIKDRETLAIVLDGRLYFIKRYWGCGWREIVKESLQGRLPVLGAGREWFALKRLAAIGIRAPRPVGWGARGWSPARRQSFVVTEALEGMISLEDLLQVWGQLKAQNQKRLKSFLVQKIAKVAYTLHSNGLNHRDFYLCHFLLKDRDWQAWDGEQLELYLIDLHRAQMRKSVPRRWLVKDLGGLLFSALDCQLSQSDGMRFLQSYCRGNLSKWAKDKRFWRQIVKRALQLYLKTHGREPPLPVWLASFA